MNAFEILSQSLEDDINRFDKESKKHKSLYRRCQNTLITLTAITTIVAGAGLVLPESSGKFVQFTVLFLTVVTAAVTAWAEMRQARELWQHEREVYYALIDIQREMKFTNAIGKGLSNEELKEQFDKIGAILGSSYQKWANIKAKSKPQEELIDKTLKNPTASLV